MRVVFLCHGTSKRESERVNGTFLRSCHTFWKNCERKITLTTNSVHPHIMLIVFMFFFFQDEQHRKIRKNKKNSGHDTRSQLQKKGGGDEDDDNVKVRVQ